MKNRVFRVFVRVRVRVFLPGLSGICTSLKRQDQHFESWELKLNSLFLIVSYHLQLLCRKIYLSIALNKNSLYFQTKIVYAKVWLWVCHYSSFVDYTILHKGCSWKCPFRIFVYDVSQLMSTLWINKIWLPRLPASTLIWSGCCCDCDGVKTKSNPSLLTKVFYGVWQYFVFE